MQSPYRLFEEVSFAHLHCSVIGIHTPAVPNASSESSVRLLTVTFESHGAWQFPTVNVGSTKPHRNECTVRCSVAVAPAELGAVTVKWIDRNAVRAVARRSTRRYQT